MLAGGNLPQKTLHCAQARPNPDIEIRHRVHALKIIFHHHRDHGSQNHGKAQPERVLRALVHREKRLIPQRNRAGESKAETDGGNVVRNDPNEVERQEKWKPRSTGSA